MKVEFTRLDGDSPQIDSGSDAMDLIGKAFFEKTKTIVIEQAQLSPRFFDLSSGLAGDVLQKVSNYRMQLVIVGDFSGYESKSLRDFMYESNKNGQVIFAEDIERGLSMLKGPFF